MPGIVLALDIGEKAVSAVRVKGGFKGQELIDVAHVPISEQEGFDSGLQRLAGIMELTCDLSAVCISPSAFYYRNLDLPFSSTKSIKRILAYELESLTSIPPDDFVFDFTIYERDGERTKLFAALKQRDEFKALLESLKTVGIDPDTVTIGWLPLMQWLTLTKAGPEQGLVIELGLHRTVIYGFLNLKTFLIRYLGEGPPGSRNRDKTGGPRGQHSDIFLDFLVKGLSDTLHAVKYSETISFEPARIYVAGPGAKSPFFLEGLRVRTGIECEDLDIFEAALVKKEKIHGSVPDLAVLQGATAAALTALRRMEVFNFRKGVFAKRGDGVRLKKRAGEACFWLLLILGLISIKLWADYDFLKKRNDSILEAMNRIYLDTFPQSTRVLDPLRQMKVAVNEAARGKGPAESDVRVIEILSDISNRIPPQIEMRITRFSMDQDGIRLAGRTDTFNTVSDIKSRLDSSPYYSAVTISSANAEQSGKGVQFEMLLKREGK